MLHKSSFRIACEVIISVSETVARGAGAAYTPNSTHSAQTPIPLPVFRLPSPTPLLPLLLTLGVDAGTAVRISDAFFRYSRDLRFAYEQAAATLATFGDHILLEKVFHSHAVVYKKTIYSKAIHILTACTDLVRSEYGTKYQTRQLPSPRAHRLTLTSDNEFEAISEEAGVADSPDASVNVLHVDSLLHSLSLRDIHDPGRDSSSTKPLAPPPSFAHRYAKVVNDGTLFASSVPLRVTPNPGLQETAFARYAAGRVALSDAEPSVQTREPRRRRRIAGLPRRQISATPDNSNRPSPIPTPPPLIPSNSPMRPPKSLLPESSCAETQTFTSLRPRKLASFPTRRKVKHSIKCCPHDVSPSPTYQAQCRGIFPSPLSTPNPTRIPSRTPSLSSLSSDDESACSPSYVGPSTPDSASIELPPVLPQSGFTLKSLAGATKDVLVVSPSQMAFDLGVPTPRATQSFSFSFVSQSCFE
ncbi:hypothetical protein K488DRAFT_86831 [Vararia minispora EC-137]|uniref:Uncharacterized protein n=1 Tax=Vararia minispora EC-137 TaxID=1314806 RepID=A0ACB8QIC9_9AGAM|nr:hypothetical protein K488DRAFT_86831 [Vararia minispora EC-137]